MVLPTTVEKTIELIVMADTKTLKKSSLLFYSTQKRNSMKVAKWKQIHSQPLLLPMREKDTNNKKRKYPQANQW